MTVAKRKRGMGSRRFIIFHKVCLGHKAVRTAVVYMHVLNRRGPGVPSPADAL